MSSRHPAPKFAAKIVAVLAVMLAIFSFAPDVVSASPAAPETPAKPIEDSGGSDGVPYGTVYPCTESAGSFRNNRSSENLPIQRWASSAGSFHTRLGSKITDDFGQKLSRSIVAPIALTVGNSMWQMSAGIMEFSEQFDILQSVGCRADEAAARIGSGMINGGMLALLAAAGLLAMLWTEGRKETSLKELMGGPGRSPFLQGIVKMVTVLGIFAVMFAGAARTEASGVISTGSPAWFAVKTNEVAGIVTAPLVKAMVEINPGVSDIGSEGGVGTGNCGSYVRELHDRYVSDSKSVAVVMSAMWEQSGLSIWSAAQFGQKNPYGEYTYCHLLEREAGTPFAEQVNIWNAAYASYGGMPEGTEPGRKMFTGGNNTEVDQRTVFLAQCRWTGSDWAIAGSGDSGDDGWAAVDMGSPPSKSECSDKWSTDSDWGGPFEWTDSPGQIADRTEATPSVADFMYNFHGDSTSGAISLSIIYVVVALLMLIIFGGLGLAVIIAKTAACVMIILVFAVLGLSLLPSFGRDKATRYFKSFIGMTIYSFALQIILAIVVVTTSFIAAAGTQAFGDGSIMSVLWMGLAPIAAVVIISMLMKEALGAPSVLSPGSGMAWGAAAGGVGGAAAGALNSLGNKAKGAATGKAKGAGAGAAGAAGAALGFSGGKKPAPERKHGMKPDSGDDSKKPGGGKPGDNFTPGGKKLKPGENVHGPSDKEKADAAKWRREGEGKYADKGYVTRVAHGTKDRGAERAKEKAGEIAGRVGAAWDRARANPVRAAARGAAKAAGVGAAFLSLPAAPIVASGVAAYGIRKANQARSERPAARAHRDQANVLAFRQAQQQRMVAPTSPDETARLARGERRDVRSINRSLDDMPGRQPDRSVRGR